MQNVIGVFHALAGMALFVLLLVPSSTGLAVGGQHRDCRVPADKPASIPEKQMKEMANILVLCTGNSCRSQMAEGFLRHLAGDRFNVYSAGTSPADRVHPMAVRVMAEIGIDISRHQPKGVREYLGRLSVRYLIIVCDKAEENCPSIWPGMQTRLFWPFDDPTGFVGSPQEMVEEFRRVRDQIVERITAWLAAADNRSAGFV